MTEYTREYPIHDIPNYPTLYIRDGAFVFMVDKNTGEISNKLTLKQYVEHWRKELETNEHIFKYYLGNYFHPKPSPDTATNIKELHRLCSDKTRRRKGDSGYFLDFIHSDKANATQSKLFWWMCKKVDVWNYAIFTQSELNTSINRTSKQIKKVVTDLEEMKLIKILTDKFDYKDQWHLLVKVHPKLYWKGRYEAWATRASLDYEYEDFLKGLEES